MIQTKYRKIDGSQIQCGVRCGHCDKWIRWTMKLSGPMGILTRLVKNESEGEAEFPGHYRGCDNPSECELQQETEE